MSRIEVKFSLIIFKYRSGFDQAVEILDVSLHLKNECYRPFVKPGDRPKYVNSKSNRPPSILRYIPLAINKRLSSISSSKEIFDQAAPLYQTELNRAGYNHKLEYQNPTEAAKRKRHRKGQQLRLG